MTQIREERTSPLASQVVLIVGFVLLVAAGIATVLVPELTSEEEADAPAEAAETVDPADPPDAPAP